MRKVFVVGAGASVPYGLPTSGELTYQIATEPPRGYLASIRQFGMRDIGKLQAEQVLSKWHQFSRQLKDAGPPSIDRFLENNPEWADLGRTCIAYRLLLAQSQTAEAGLSADWYRWLFNVLFPHPKADRFKRCTVITFNYDTTLEHALVTMYKNAFSSHAGDAESIVASMAIHHVYGSLPMLPSGTHQDLSSGRMRPEIVRSAGQGIRLITERAAGAMMDTFRAARDAVAAADAICFLGFGFDHTNLERIGLHPSHSEFWTRRQSGKIATIGTRKGLYINECNHVPLSGPAGDVLKDATCLELLRDSGVRGWIEQVD